jgi:anti-anti-sigma regulatory factor
LGSQSRSPLSNSCGTAGAPTPPCWVRAHGVKGYHDITRYPDARLIPGLVLFRWDAPLFFANAEFFRERVLDAVAKSPTPVRWLVVAAEPVTSVDVSAGDAVAELDEALHAQGIELCFAELKDPVKDKLKRFGLFSQLGEQYFFPTVGAAVSSYLEIHDVEWEDWEDQAKRYEVTWTRPGLTESVRAEIGPQARAIGAVPIIRPVGAPTIERGRLPGIPGAVIEIISRPLGAAEWNPAVARRRRPDADLFWGDEVTLTGLRRQREKRRGCDQRGSQN